MNNLDRTLKKEGIHNEKELRKYISNFPPDSPFTLINEQNINTIHNIDYDPSEHRIFDKLIDFKLCIIDIPTINFKDSSQISLVDTLFTGNVSIPSQNKKDILCDCCIFLKTLFLGSPGALDHVTIYKSNIYSLYISGLETNELYLGENNIELLVISGSKIKELNVSFNKINGFWTSASDFSKTSFRCDQVNYKYYTGLNRLKYFSKKLSGYLSSREPQVAKSTKKLFSFVDTKAKYYFDDFHDDGNKDTIDFFYSHTDVKNNRDKYSVLLLNNSIFSQKNVFQKLFIYILGGFANPRLFLLYGIFVYLLFSFLYSMPFLYFKVDGVATNLSICNSLYFSGVTFTTIGYGDIAPIELSRFMAFIEGILGILISSSFLVSLVRKYCD